MALPWPVDAKGRRLTLDAIVSATPAQGPRGNIGHDAAARVVARLRDMDVASMYAFSDGAANVGIPTTGNGNDVLLRLNAGKTIYGVLVANAGYTPTASESWMCVLETQDQY
jgi:hypothetical protein